MRLAEQSRAGKKRQQEQQEHPGTAASSGAKETQRAPSSAHPAGLHEGAPVGLAPLWNGQPQLAKAQRCSSVWLGAGTGRVRVGWGVGGGVGGGAGEGQRKGARGALSPH